MCVPARIIRYFLNILYVNMMLFVSNIWEAFERSTKLPQIAFKQPIWKARPDTLEKSTLCTKLLIFLCSLCRIKWVIISFCSFRWHRIAFSVHNKSVTLYLDCERVETLDLLRGDDAVVSTEGVTVFGTRLLDEEVFEVCYYEIILNTKNKETVCLKVHIIV